MDELIELDDVKYFFLINRLQNFHAINTSTSVYPNWKHGYMNL